MPYPYIFLTMCLPNALGFVRTFQVPGDGLPSAGWDRMESAGLTHQRQKPGAPQTLC